MRHYVYKHWDKDGALLYVGCCKNLKQRTGSHHSAHWFKDIHKITHDLFPDRVTALAKEKSAIQSDLPKYNKQHHPDNDTLTAPLPEPPASLARTKSGGYTSAYVRYLISKKCHDDAGSVLGFAKKKKVSHSHLSSVIRGVQRPTERMLGWVGIKKAIAEKVPEVNPMANVCYE